MPLACVALSVSLMQCTTALVHVKRPLCHLNAKYFFVEVFFSFLFLTGCIALSTMCVVTSKVSYFFIQNVKRPSVSHKNGTWRRCQNCVKSSCFAWLNISWNSVLVLLRETKESVSRALLRNQQTACSGESQLSLRRRRSCLSIR